MLVALNVLLSVVAIHNMSVQSPTTIYLIPGQGGDQRLFTHLRIEGDFDIKHIHCFTPEKGLSMREYAEQLTEQIDVANPFVIVGVSLGGMLATEMSELVPAKKVIVISSAKTRNELPGRYKFQRKLPVHRLVPPRLALLGAKMLQPIVEPDRQKEKDIFKSMLRDKDPIFLDRTIEMIMTWDRLEAPDNIIHIHGSNDHTIPIRNVTHDHCIKGGSHMMTLTQAEAVSDTLNPVLTGM